MSYSMDTSYLAKRPATLNEQERIRMFLNLSDLEKTIEKINEIINEKINEKINDNSTRSQIESYLKNKQMFPQYNLSSFVHVQRGFKINREIRDEKGCRTGNTYIEEYWHVESGKFTKFHNDKLYVFMTKFMNDGQYICKHVCLDELCKLNSLDEKKVMECLEYTRIQVLDEIYVNNESHNYNSDADDYNSDADDYNSDTLDNYHLDRKLKRAGLNKYY